jgi:serine phosphatase RsbU (regulator of sigma subunit)/Tfp pilus assembly protein PilF
VRKLFVFILLISCCDSFSQFNFDSLYKAIDTVKSAQVKMEKIVASTSKKLLANSETEQLKTKILELADQSRTEKSLAEAYLQIAFLYMGQSKPNEEITYTFKSLKIAENLKDTLLILKCYYNLGSAYFDLKNEVFAKRHLFNATKYFGPTNNKEIERYKSNVYNNLGTSYKDKGQLDSALFFHKNALQIRLKLKSNKLIAASYNNMGLVYKKKKDYDNALLYFKQSLDIKREIGDKKGEAGTSINIGNLLVDQQRHKEALRYLQYGTDLARSIKDGPFYENGLEGLAICYQKMKDYKNSVQYYARHSTVKDSLAKGRLNKEIAELSAQYESNKKDAELLLREEKLKNQQGEIKKQKIFIASVVAVLLLVILLVVIVYRSYKINKRNAKELAQKNEVIGQKNKEITDSINYARRIQSSLLSSGQSLTDFVSEHFILYKPKDIVSGDFYWIYSSNTVEETHTTLPLSKGEVREAGGGTNSEFRTKHSELLIAAADCTGHGVPGAFMSLVGKENLDKSASLSTEPGKILSTLNRNVKKALQQDSGEISRDGMDVALVKLNRVDDKLKVSYAGANRPLWIFRKGKEDVEEIKATKHAIAGFTDDEQIFDQHSVLLEKGDTIYLFSDGYPDQFGGDKHKKLTTKKFREILQSQKGNSLDRQKAFLEDFLNAWRGDSEQIDDVLVIGIRI